ncbi:hypothetical protein [Methylobacterium gnaphalii]|nr:hypothetical protein [Methylobacterium gnaphalii]
MARARSSTPPGHARRLPDTADAHYIPLRSADAIGKGAAAGAAIT